jgi:hypothetical protein
MMISEVDAVCTGSPSPEIQSRMCAMQSDFQIRACNSVGDSSELGQQVIDQLELLDDTIFEALNGDVTALERSAGVWGSALQNLGAEILEESRQQYLRQAETEWQRHRLQPSHSLPKVFTALEIISLLEGGL